jgi:hypothetical protein
VGALAGAPQRRSYSATPQMDFYETIILLFGKERRTIQRN